MRWLDEISALILQEELERDPSLTYDQYWAKMDLSFGASGKDQLRRQLRSVRLQTKGKLAERDWSEVYSKITPSHPSLVMCPSQRWQASS